MSRDDDTNERAQERIPSIEWQDKAEDTTRQSKEKKLAA